MRNFKFKTAVVILLCLLVLFCSTQTAFADEERPYGYTDETKEHMDHFEEEVLKVLKVFRVVASAGATASVAVGAFKMLLSMWGIGGKDSEKELAKAKRLILYSLIALAALMFLEPVVNIGAKLGVRYGWKPSKISTESKIINIWVPGGWWLYA